MTFTPPLPPPLDPAMRPFAIAMTALIVFIGMMLLLNGCGATPPGAGSEAVVAAHGESDAPAPKGSAPTLNRVGALMLWSIIPLTILSFTPWGTLLGWTSIAATGIVGVTLMETAVIMHNHAWVGWLLVAACPAMFGIEALELKSGTAIVERVRGLLPRSLPFSSAE